MSSIATETTPEPNRALINKSALILLGLFVIGLGFLAWEPIVSWLQGEEGRDQALLEQWIQQSRIGQHSLPGLLASHEKSRKANIKDVHALHRREIADFLQELGTPVSLTQSGYLPLFPVVYRMEVHFPPLSSQEPVIWDSGLPRIEKASKIRFISLGDECEMILHVQLRAYQDRINIEEEQSRRKASVGFALMGLTGTGLAWIGMVGWRLEIERRARRRARETALLLKSEELKQELGRQMEFLASLNVVAGSYAHNLQNLLLPPVGLVDECLELLDEASPAKQKLQEVRRLLELVSDRVRQTLKAIRRDPSPGPIKLIDLGLLTSRIAETWHHLGITKWQVRIETEIEPDTHVEGQESHLEQVLENLIINARDAIFAKRREMVANAQESRQENSIDSQRVGILEAMRWQGTIKIRVCISPDGDFVVLEVSDNGIGMDTDTAAKCLQAGYSTKKDQAIHQGASSGAGLGLTFVATAAHRHQAKLQINSKLAVGTTVSLLFPRSPKKKTSRSST